MRLLLFSVLLVLSTIASAEVDKVLIDKSESKLYLTDHENVVKTYSVAFGANPIGHKQQEGDEKTPEGFYVLDYKKADSSFHKAIHISYPNEEDQSRAKERGVSPGGLIMIHGQKNGWAWLAPVTQLFNWTDGCIAVTNKEMDEIWGLVKTGTRIEIRP